MGVWGLTSPEEAQAQYNELLKTDPGALATAFRTI